jgi:hypothetical protein
MRLAQAMMPLARRTYCEAIATARDPDEIAIVVVATTDPHAVALIDRHHLPASTIQEPGPEFQGEGLPSARAVAIPRADVCAALDSLPDGYGDPGGVRTALGSRLDVHVPLVVLSDGAMLALQIPVQPELPD